MKIIVPTLFLILISLPALFMAKPQWDAAATMAQKEIRPPAPWHELFSDTEYGKKTEAYFNEHFGLRNLMIRAKNQLDYSLFGYSPQVIIGKDGWLSNRSVAMGQTWNVDHLSDEQWQQTKQRIELFSQRLKDVGVKLYVLPVPLKITVHPEHYPQIASMRPEHNGYLKIRDLIKSLPGVGLIDVYEIFKRDSQREVLFYKTDLHWNDIGAMTVSKEIVAQLSQSAGAPMEWRDPVAFHYTEFALGGDATSLGLLFPITERVPFLNSIKSPCGIYPGGADSLPSPQPYGALFMSNGACKKPLIPQTIIVGNSYMIYFYQNGLLDHFEKVYLLHDLLSFQLLLQNIPRGTKFLIWQFFESEIPAQLQSPEWWDQLASPARIVQLGQ